MEEKKRATTTRRAFDSSVWLGLEMAVSFLAVTGYSIAVARVLGPARLGYFQVVWFWSLVGSNLAMLGIPGTTRRYMAEALGRNDLPLARGIYVSTWRLQLPIALAILAVGEFIVFKWTDPGHWSSSWLLILCLAPRLLASTPGMAQMAAERLNENLVATLANSVAMIAVLWIGLSAGWGLVAPALAYLAGYVVDLAVKTAFTARWMKWRPRAPISPELRQRMLSFSGKSLLLMLLGFVVWDKSDIFFLQMFDKDPRSWTFFTSAIGFAEKIISIVSILGSSISVALYGEIGRSTERLRQTAAIGLRYSALLASVLMFGLAAVAPWLVVTMYGRRYAPAGPMLSVAALLAGGKCILPVLSTVYAAAERQGAMVIIVVCGGALDVTLDLLLIPRWGAMGATLANGIAQCMAVAVMIWYSGRTCGVEWKVRGLVPGAIAGLGVGVAAWLAGHWMPAPALKLAAGVAAGAVVCPILFRQLRVFDPEDARRFHELSGRTPAWMRSRIDPLLRYVAAPGRA